MYLKTVESMRIVDGRLLNASYHNQRMERTFRNFYHIPTPADAADDAADVETIIRKNGIPEQFQKGTVKCRLLYGFKQNELVTRVEYSVYKKRSVLSLKLVEGSPDYSFKYANRDEINKLYEQRGDCDDIIIVKNGLLTDASSANITFLKNERWYTPAKPLLKGTTRARMISEGTLIVLNITVNQLFDFEAVRLINAMLPFEEQPLIPVSSIKVL